jgi:single-strand DNA-binding protein
VNEPTIHFSGNLAAKPTLKPVETPNGVSVVANLRVAVTPRRKARAGEEWSDGETIWFNVSAWRTTATNCVASLNQGDRVVVTGRLTQRTWKDAEGLEHQSFEVVSDDVALDLSRNAALVVRRPAPAQRQEEPPAEGDDGWLSTGQVDESTGGVAMTPREGEPASEPAAV